MWFVAAPFFKPNYCFLIKLYYSCFCCCCSVTKSYPTLCDPMDRSTPGFPVLHHLPKFSQTHVRLFCVSVSLSCHSAFFKKKKSSTQTSHLALLPFFGGVVKWLQEEGRVCDWNLFGVGFLGLSADSAPRGLRSHPNLLDVLLHGLCDPISKNGHSIPRHLNCNPAK